MPIYRFFPLDLRQRIAAPASDLELADDAAACRHARGLLTEHPGVQVWQSERLVHCTSRDAKAS